MSRLNRYKHALVSGYVALGANMVYTLASVPLALAYLSGSEFGLWAIVTQLGGYMALVDLGMSGSVARILIDYKDDRTDGRYGSTVLTSVLVGFVQGALVMLVGVGFAFVGAGLLRVPPDMERQFFWLILGQSVIQALGFSLRALPLVLTAHQRLDVINYSQAALFGVSYLTLWVGFAWHFGLYSALWSQAIVQVLTLAIYAWWCFRLELLPAGREWSSATWERFKEVFAFGTDVFLFTVGTQMVNASQAILIAPCLGLEAAGAWSVCTRAYAVVYQIVIRIFDSSATLLSELYVRGEDAKLFERFRSITILTSSVAVLAAVLFALCNQPFVAVWAKGRFGWSSLNDVLLGVWLVLMCVQRCHAGILGVTKQLGTVKYVYFAEGCVFLGLASLSTRPLGFTGVIGSSIVATSCLSLAYGLWRTKTDFQLIWPNLLGWLRPAAIVAVPLILWAVGLGWLLRHWTPLLRFTLTGGATGVLGAILLLRWGLDQPMQDLLRQKLPHPLRALLP